jgi:hypothetical protein
LLREIVSTLVGREFGGIRGFNAGAIGGAVVAEGVVVEAGTARAPIVRIERSSVDAARPGDGERVVVRADLVAARVDRPVEIPARPICRGVEGGYVKRIGVTAVVVEGVLRLTGRVVADMGAKADLDVILGFPGEAAVGIPSAKDGVGSYISGAIDRNSRLPPSRKPPNLPPARRLKYSLLS